MIDMSEGLGGADALTGLNSELASWRRKERGGKKTGKESKTQEE
jgi:hypothetical protein